MMYTLTNVTCGLWDSSLADGFNFSISYKFVMLLSLPLAIVRYNNIIIIIIKLEKISVKNSLKHTLKQ